MKSEKLYYAYKNKSDVYYLTKSEEMKLLEHKNKFIKTLNDKQLKAFSELEKCYETLKDALIKEIISFAVNYED